MITSSQISDYKGGWFVGAFDPAVIRTPQAEVSCKSYAAGDKEERHYHAIATEVTVIVRGAVRMNGVVYTSGSVITIPYGESTDFEALTACDTTVVKVPSVLGDKFLGPGPKDTAND